MKNRRPEHRTSRGALGPRSDLARDAACTFVARTPPAPRLESLGPMPPITPNAAAAIAKISRARHRQFVVDVARGIHNGRTPIDAAEAAVIRAFRRFKTGEARKEHIGALLRHDAIRCALVALGVPVAMLLDGIA